MPHVAGFQPPTKFMMQNCLMRIMCTTSGQFDSIPGNSWITAANREIQIKTCQG